MKTTHHFLTSIIFVFPRNFNFEFLLSDIMIINNKNPNEKIPFCFEQKQASYSFSINHFYSTKRSPGVSVQSFFGFSWKRWKNEHCKIIKHKPHKLVNLMSNRIIKIWNHNFYSMKIAKAGKIMLDNLLQPQEVDGVSFFTTIRIMFFLFNFLPIINIFTIDN